MFDKSSNYELLELKIEQKLPQKLLIHTVV